MTALHPSVKKQTRTANFLALVVEPTGSFLPRNWQDIPGAYRIVEFIGHKKHRGEADAWRFLYNRDAMQPSHRRSDVGPNRWAIWIS